MSTTEEPTPEITANSQPPKAPSATEWTCIGSASDYTTRTTIKVHKRRVTVLRLRKRGTKETRWQCIDTTCYHAGGPLGEGPIVTVGDRTCLKCPWHFYLIDLFTGEGLYLDADERYRSKGARQRVHHVEERDDGLLYVRLSLDAPEIESDSYAYADRLGRTGDHLTSFP